MRAKVIGPTQGFAVAVLLGVLLLSASLAVACGGSTPAPTTAAAQLELSARWTELPATDPTPAPRSGISLVYDPDSVQMLLFGGWDVDTDFGDTWSYDPDTQTWTDIQLGGVLPAPRALYQAVWDTSSARLVLFGGTSDAGRFGDTWTYDPAASAWTQVEGAGTPQARSAHAMVYDSETGKVVLFGGIGDAGRFDDTWTFDALAGTWTQIATQGTTGTAGNAGPPTTPSARSGHAMVYDPNAKVTLLFGGYDGAFLNDTWAFDSGAGTWTKLAPTGGVPSARGNHHLVYDADNGLVVLFGGNDGTSELDDVWVYDAGANQWQRVTASAGADGGTPPAREEHGLVYDPTVGRILVFGGIDNNDTELGDLWELTLTR